MPKTLLAILYGHLLFIVYLLPFKVAASDTINIASDEWCPYICKEVHRPGILVEVLNEIAKHDGFEINFNIMPLARSLRLLQASKLDAVLALTAEHIEEFTLNRSQNVFGGLYNDFYTEEASEWEFTNIENLKQFIEQGNILVLIKGYEYGKGINSLKATSARYIYSATGENPLPNILGMLSKGRIAVLLDSRFSVEYEILNGSINNLKHVGTDGIFVPLYIGYAPNIDIKYIHAFDKGLVRLRTTNQLSKILKHYGIDDWKFQNIH